MNWLKTYTGEQLEKELEHLRMYEKSQKFLDEELVPFLKSKKLNIKVRYVSSYYVEMEGSDVNEIWIDFLDTKLIKPSFCIMTYLCENETPYAWSVWGMDSKKRDIHTSYDFNEDEMTVENAYMIIKKSFYDLDIQKTGMEQLSLFDLGVEL